MPEPHFSWVASADRPALAAAGWEVVEFDRLLGDVVARAPGPGPRLRLANPAQAWLDRVAESPGLAVVGVRLTNLSELAALHGYVLDPAWRSRTSLLVESSERLSRLPPDRFLDPRFDYPYTLERALDAAMRLFRGRPEPGTPQAVPRSRVELDAEQQRAVDAHDGVVQVIAPAGSGKTTVLIERARELRRRGAPAASILAATFNTAARRELADRLAAAGLGGVQARTFHSLGRWILTEERLIAGRETKLLSPNQWTRLCARAGREVGGWLEVSDARAAISEIKLGALATPAEFRRRADDANDTPLIARVYELYEDAQREAATIDYDDLILLAVRALREDAELRRRWQSRFRQVLVDEYQDIEPAQELLVRILAAPQDGFFCVGDEDQTLYGWRRASVRRMIDLDAAYPGLVRISLAHNYRCPPEVVAASRRLIEGNAIRFPKPIHAAPGRPAGGLGALELREATSQAQAAERIARVLAERERGEIAVLARTTNLLRAVALACVAPRVRISAPEAVFEARGARRALEAYVRLAAVPAESRPEDVALACRAPNRGLPYESEERVAALLRDGFSFAESFAGLATTGERQRAKLDDAGRVLDALAAMIDAGKFIRYLRGPGGLDAYYTEHDESAPGTEQIELEVLEQAHAEAAGHTVVGYNRLLQARADALADIRDDDHGIELTTIHAAKGRQWPEVQLFACEEGQLPHRHALEVTPEEEAAGEGLEAERRLAYVAFTRAQERLVLSTTDGAASRFLTEAGLGPTRPFRPPQPPRPPGRPPAPPRPRSSAGASGPRRPGRADPGGQPADDPASAAQRVGLAQALGAASSPADALEIAAAVIERRLIGPATGSERMTLAELLDCLEGLGPSARERILLDAGIRTERVLLSRLDAGGRPRLARALRSAAASPGASPTRPRS